uniref:Uncharacterized protein n=1 Tax=Arundo donax TaxID=35708 RepID=A0A0A8Y666_ARUDO
MVGHQMPLHSTSIQLILCNLNTKVLLVLFCLHCVWISLSYIVIKHTTCTLKTSMQGLLVDVL